MTQNQNGKTQTSTALFRILSPPQEQTGQSADPILMRQIAASGGGEALQISELSRLPSKLRALERATRSNEPARPLWENPLVLLTLFSLLSFEWFLRRRTGI
jgi:hypothetical protein